jgi:hypothetical protein
MDSPIKYARNGNVHLAYRVFGGGPRDIVLVPGTLSHVEALWGREATLANCSTGCGPLRESSSSTSAARVSPIESHPLSTPSRTDR